MSERDCLGIFCCVKVGSTPTAPKEYTTLEGQTNAVFDGSVNTVETTAKDNNGWQTHIATNRSGQVTVSGIMRSQRPELKKLETAWVTGTTHSCQICFDRNGNGYVGDFFVTQFNVSGDVNGAVNYNITLMPSGALSKIP